MANAGDLLAWRLRAARLVRRFLDYNRDLYLNGAVDASFPWFNADAYLSAYPEIRKQLLEQLRRESASSGSDTADPGAAQLRAAAVRHYLDHGALEGRGSQTAFDPVWAIVAQPDIAIPRHGALRPEELAAVFPAATGRNDTGWFAVGTPDRILQVLTTAAEDTGNTGSPAVPSENDTGSSESDDSAEGKGEGENLYAYTYLLYLCGSDLETDNGEGSQAIYDVDCCLMGSTEIAYYLNEYYDYMVASEEITRGSLAYDEMFRLLAAGAEDPARAAREAALNALAVRHQSWRGGATDFEGGAVIDGKRAEAAAAALNGLAGRMLTFMNTGNDAAKSDHRSLVYDTLWSVRVRCYNFGTAVNGSKTAMNDLVDTGDFLTQLRNELKLRESSYRNPDAATKAFFRDLLGEDKKSGLIGSALTAADALTLAHFGVINQNYMYSSGIPGVAAEKTWEQLRSATELTGSSIYFPYFSPDDLKKYRDSKQNPWDSGKSLLFGDASSYAKLMKGFTEYIGLTESGSTESEKSRIEYLKLELTEGKRLKTNDKGVPEKNKNGDYIYTDEKVPGYEELLKIRWTGTTGTDKQKKEDHLEISVDSNVYTGQNWSQWSRGDAFADLMDTAETMTVFITRAVEAKLRERSNDSSGGEKADNEPVMIDLVIGQHKIRYNSTDGGADKIRVFANAIDSSISNMAEGSVAHYYNNTNEFEGWHTWQELVVPYADVEDYGDKKRAIDSVLGPDKDRDLKEYTIFRGGVTMKDQNARVPQDVCLIFGKNKDGDTVYLGAAERTSVKNAKADEAAYTYSKIDGIDEIRFDHLMIYDGADTNRKDIAYAENYYDLVSPTYYSVSHLDTAPVYLKDPNNEDHYPGEASQNKYYLALMPEYGLGDSWSVFILDQTLYDTSEEAAAKGEVAAEKPQTKAEEKTEAEEKPTAAAAASGAKSAENEDAGLEVHAGTGATQTESTDALAGNPDKTSETAGTAETAETTETAETAGTAETAETSETADNKVTDNTLETSDADENNGQPEDNTVAQDDGSGSQTDDISQIDDGSQTGNDSQTDNGSNETGESQTDCSQTDSTGTETESSNDEPANSQPDSGDVETAGSQADSSNSEAGNSAGETEDSQADSSDREADSSTVPYEKEAA